MSTCTDDQTYRKNLYPPIFIYSILHQIRVQSSPKISLNCHQINPFDHKKKQRDSDDNIIPCDKSILYTHLICIAILSLLPTTFRKYISIERWTHFNFDKSEITFDCMKYSLFFSYIRV